MSHGWNPVCWPWFTLSQSVTPGCGVQVLASTSQKGYRMTLVEACTARDVTRALEALSAAAPTVASSLAGIPGIAGTLTDCVDFMLAVVQDAPALAAKQAGPESARPRTADSMPLFPIPENISVVDLPGTAGAASCGGGGGELQGRSAGQVGCCVAIGRQPADLLDAAQEVRVNAVRCAGPRLAVPASVTQSCYMA
jgi:hypothetical protein